MNELTTQSRQLPDTLEDLARFVLIGREKLTAVRAEIRAIEKVQLAAEVHEQKLEEAQEIAEAVLDAETKLGELTSKMQKAVNQYAADNAVGSKKQQLEKVGISERTAERYETLSRHPETVEKAKADARAEGRIVTRQDVLNRIIQPQRKNPIKDISKEAWKNHMKVALNPVVDLEDIKKDKENTNLILADAEQKIIKAIGDCSVIGIIPERDITEMWRRKNETEKKEFQRSLLNASKVIARILVLSEERNEGNL